MKPPAFAFIVLVELFNCDAIHRSLNVPNGIPVVRFFLFCLSSTTMLLMFCIIMFCSQISSCNMCDVVSVPMNETFYVGTF